MSRQSQRRHVARRAQIRAQIERLLSVLGKVVRLRPFSLPIGALAARLESTAGLGGGDRHGDRALDLSEPGPVQPRR